MGEEVIRRPVPKIADSASNEELRNLVVQTAKDEGYDLAPETITVVR